MQDKKIENEFLVDDVNGKEVTNSSYPSFERSWLKAICSIVLKTSAEKQEDCNLSEYRIYNFLILIFRLLKIIEISYRLIS